MDSVTVHRAPRVGFYLESEHGAVFAAGTIADVLAVIAEEFGDAELAARIIARPDPVAEPVKDADGWVTWGGGQCPVPGNVVVEIRCANGKLLTDWAGELCWRHDGDGADIIAYRLAPQPDADDGA